MARTWWAAVGGCVALAGLFAIGWAADVTWMRIGFGLPVVLLLPGGLMVWSMFPAHRAVLGKRQLQLLERLVLSVGLSVVLLGLLGLLLTSLGLFRETPFVLVLFLLLALLLTLAVWRSSRVPEADRWPSFATPGRLPASTMALLVLAVVATASVVGFMASPKDPVHYAELALLGPRGDRTCYPSAYVNGTYLALELNGINNTVREPGCPVPSERVKVLVADHGPGDAHYTLAVWWTEGNGTRIAEADVGTLALDLSGSPGLYARDLKLPPPPGPGNHTLVIQLYHGSAPAIHAGENLPAADYEVRLVIRGSP